MPAVGLSTDQFARVFGEPDPLDKTGPGRSRKCKSCGDWHRTDKPWPHNCRKEGPPRNPDLKTPQIAPAFEPFKTGVLPTAEVIGSRDDKREYMKRNDLVEFDEGVSNAPSWTADRERKREIVRDIKRFAETDPLNLPPDLKAQRMDETGSLEDGTEINTDDIEVIK